ncbi:acyl-CoA thioesterase [Cytobacillus sp. FJAT-54145]|uniref:Acyl-CoA thioesterase n=1 Tax=Cytobacillus spartinae TaxID=3299023 RepID=A0ABW6KGS9_9BACI
MTYSEFTFVAQTDRGHVSNVKLFDYLDQARKDWYTFCVKAAGVEAVVVHIGVDYKQEVFQGNKLFIKTWIERIGNTSFTLKQTMVNELGELVVSADVILTTINRQTREKTSVPSKIRALLTQDSILDLSLIVSQTKPCK